MKSYSSLITTLHDEPPATGRLGYVGDTSVTIFSASVRRDENDKPSPDSIHRFAILWHDSIQNESIIRAIEEAHRRNILPSLLAFTVDSKVRLLHGIINPQLADEKRMLHVEEQLRASVLQELGGYWGCNVTDLDAMHPDVALNLRNLQLLWNLGRASPKEYRCGCRDSGYPRCYRRIGFMKLNELRASSFV